MPCHSRGLLYITRFSSRMSRDHKYFDARVCNIYMVLCNSTVSDTLSDDTPYHDYTPYFKRTVMQLPAHCMMSDTFHNILHNDVRGDRIRPNNKFGIM